MPFRRRALWFAFCLGLAAVGGPLRAAPVQQAPVGEVEVSAKGSLEWYKGQHLYVARGSARAIRGDMTVTADLLSAHERETAKDQEKKSENNKKNDSTSAPPSGIDRLTAEGNVHIWDARQQIFGDRAVYDLDKGIAEVTGNALKYMTSKEVVTATDSLEYYDHEQMAVARGHAIGVRDDRHIEGDVLTARFSQTPAGQQEMSVLTAEGNAKVLTGETIAHCDRVVYDVKRNIAVLSGSVRITRGRSQLSGDKAEIDFASGESRLLNEGHKGRVKALLVPDPDKEKAKKAKGEKQ